MTVPQSVSRPTHHFLNIDSNGGFKKYFFARSLRPINMSRFLGRDGAESYAQEETFAANYTSLKQFATKSSRDGDRSVPAKSRGLPSNQIEQLTIPANHPLMLDLKQTGHFSSFTQC